MYVYSNTKELMSNYRHDSETVFVKYPKGVK